MIRLSGRRFWRQAEWLKRDGTARDLCIVAVAQSGLDIDDRRAIDRLERAEP